jgi:ketosteroid isomerase-like protein
VANGVGEVEEEIRRLSEETYRMFRDGDPGFLERLDPDIDWHVTDTLPEGGDLHGVTAVMDYLEAFDEDFEGKPDPEEFIELGDRVLVLGTWRGRARETGVQVEARFAHLGRWRDGRLLEFRVYIDSAKLLRALEPHGT